MTGQIGAPKGALTAIGDMLDNCAKVQPGQEILILAEIEGLYGGDSLVDREAISWIQAAVQARDANASVLWIDERPRPHAWRIPPIVKAAMAGSDLIINHSFNIVTEEMLELREFLRGNDLEMVRNFATTAPLLGTAWAQTPYELVSEIRYRAGLLFEGGKPFRLTDPNGTHLEGTILHPKAIEKKGAPGILRYAGYRAGLYYRPWPEWMHSQIRLGDTSGTYIFESMLSWWSRYIGISPYFEKPIELTIKDNRITDIKGGDEAEALRRFLTEMKGRLGEGVYDFDTLHFGVHPQASVGPHQCPSLLVRRIIDHSHSCNLHVHIGAPPPAPSYPYWLHCTGDIRTPTFKVGDNLVHDNGHLTALDDPAVRAVAAKYPGRPGLAPEPKSF